MDIHTKLQIEHLDIVSIELARGQKGSYGWTIKVHGRSVEEALALTQETDSKLKKQYGEPCQSAQ